MDEVLKRKLFNTPKYEHKSTGIASGLEYRPGYKVGGRVGYKYGSKPKNWLDVNPDLTEHMRVKTDFPDYSYPDTPTELPKFESKTGPRGIESSPMLPDTYEKMIEEEGLSLYDPLNPSEMHGPSTPRDKPQKRGPQVGEKKGIIEEYFGGMRDEPDYGDITEHMRVKTEFKDKNGEDAPTLTGMAKDLKMDLSKGEKFKKESRSELERMILELRESQDKSTKELREKQSSQKNKLALLNMISAANDPNLRAGQSRVAAGAGALTEAAREKMAWKDQIAQEDLDRQHAREEGDLHMKHSWMEADLKTIVDRENLEYAQYLQEKYKSGPIAIQKAMWIMENAKTLNLSGDELTDAFSHVLGYGETPISDDTTLMYGILNKDANSSRKQWLGEGTEVEGNPSLTTDELTQILEIIENEQGLPYADGGRVGYQEGGDVETEEGVPMVMTYEQLRDKLPPFITDDIVKLIAYSPEAFKDFANIQTQQDVDEFNDKYDVDLVLPDPEQMDYAMPSTPAAETPATGSVSVPPAVAANPQMPMQTGTGALTPTETALLDPTEQAIRMRNR